MPTSKKFVYFVGIAGRATSSIAHMFLELGYDVEGSDQNCFPPASTMLDDLGISYHTPYNAEKITRKPDLVVIGGNALIVDPNNPEYLKLKEMGCRIVSFPEVISEFIVKENSVVTVGTYGKTTTSALLSLVFQEAGFNPSYMIGGVPGNFTWGTKTSTGNWSVVEGDEHPTLGFDNRPKFVHYKPKYVLLIATAWDHMNVYKTPESYVQVFEDLANILPEDGLLVVSETGENNIRVASKAKCKALTYGQGDECDFKISDIRYEQGMSKFKINGREFVSPLIGLHNVENVTGCFALAQSCGVSDDVYQSALTKFKGVTKRLEILGEIGGVTFIDDFAPSGPRAKAAISALRKSFPARRIIAVFDPHASSLRERQSLPMLEGAFDEADLVFIGQIPRQKGTGQERVTGLDIVGAILPSQMNVSYLPSDDGLIQTLTDVLNKDDVVLFMSSGSFREVPEKVMRSFQGQQI